MTSTIATHYRNAYTDNIRMNAMHMRSHLRDSCDFEPSRGELLMLDSYSEYEANAAPGPYITAVTTLNGANVSQSVPRNRRSLAPKFWEFTEYFDPRDKVRLMKDIRPDSNWTRTVNGAFGRQMDQEIVTAYDAPAQDETGTGGALTVSAATVGESLAGTIGANTGMNVDKVIQGVEKLWTNKVQDDVPWCCVIYPGQCTQLFSFTNDDRLLSSDFSGMTPLKAGKVGDYMGVQFIPSTEIQEETVAAGLNVLERWVYFYSMDAMIFSMDGQIEVHFDVIPHLRHALQVAHYATFSATRMHESKIVRVECATVAV